MAWSLPSVPLTRKDIDASGWQDIVAGASEKTCFAFATNLLKASQQVGEAGDKREVALLLLGYVAQLWFGHDSGNAVFVTVPVNVPKDNAALDVLTDRHIETLALIVGDTADPEMRARIADVLWIRTRKPEYARAALAAYLESALRLEDPSDWPPVRDRLRRAADIGAQLGRGSEFFRKVVAHLEGVLDRHNGEDPLYLSVSCMEVLLVHRQGSPAKYAALCQRMAERCAPADADRAQRIWFLKAEWHQLAGEHEAARGARIKAAEAHVRQAELHAAGDRPSYARVAECIRRAIGILRKVEDTRGRREELHRLLLDYQKKSLSDMKEVYGGEIDLTDTVKAARNAVKGKTFLEAIRALTMGQLHPRTLDEIRRQAEETRDSHQILFLFHTQMLDGEGRVAAQSTPRPGQTITEAEAALQSHMDSTTRDFEHSLHAQGFVNPARLQMLEEHNVTLADWLVIARASPFVPPGREMLWAQALHAGLLGDMATMLHMLVPQMEHSLRHLLQGAGIVTSSLSDDGIQEDWDTRRLLAQPKLTEILGPDYVFHLRCLLVSRFGSNLRNKTAHGLLSDRDVFSWPVLYLWWLALRLCVHPLLVIERAQAAAPSVEASPGQSPSSGPGTSGPGQLAERESKKEEEAQ